MQKICTLDTIRVKKQHNTDKITAHC